MSRIPINEGEKTRWIHNDVSEDRTPSLQCLECEEGIPIVLWVLNKLHVNV
jgi:hypothetical protein